MSGKFKSKRNPLKPLNSLRATVRCAIGEKTVIGTFFFEIVVFFQIVSFQGSDVDEYRGSGFGSNRTKRYAIQ